MTNAIDDSIPDLNPATGLPLIDDTYIDVGGNPYGTDLHVWPEQYQPASYDYTPPPSPDPCWSD